MAITHLRGTDKYKIIEAKFIGTNRSLGYIKNEVYQLRLYENSNMIRVHETGNGVCVYNSLSKFMDNWDNIKIIKSTHGKSKN